MADFTKDSIFIFTNQEQDHRWKLISGSVFKQDVRDEHEMPAFTMLAEELQIECGFDKNLPFGLKLPNTTKLQFNMNAFKENGLDDVWNIIRDNSKAETGAFWEGPDTFKYLIKPDFKLLNCWVFEKKTPGEDTWKIIDIFTQVDKKTITKVKKGKFTFEIELVSLWKTITEKIVFQLFNQEWYYKSKNYQNPSFRAFCGLPDDALSNEQLDFSTRRRSLQVGNKNLKYWAVNNTHQVYLKTGSGQEFIKRSYFVQDTKSDKRSENGRIHLRLLRADRAFLTMSYAFVQLFKLYTRGKIFTDEQTWSMRIPNPLQMFRFFKNSPNEDGDTGAKYGDEVQPNELYITEGLYEAVTDGNSSNRWLDYKIGNLPNPLYSKFKNLWDFISEFYQSYPVIVRFDCNQKNFVMDGLFSNYPISSISSASLDSETLEYEKFNSEFNSYELVVNCSGTNPSNRIIFEESGESESAQTKYIAQHIFNNFRNKLNEYSIWQGWSSPGILTTITESKMSATFANANNFHVGLIVYPTNDFNFLDGNEKQVFQSVGNHFVFNGLPNYQPVWYPTDEIKNADTESRLSQYLQRTNLNGFSAFCQGLLQEYLLNSGKSALLTFTSKFYGGYDMNDVGAPMQIYINQIFREMLDLNITELPETGIMCTIGKLKKDYIKNENEIKLFIRGK